jgi:hypothetical protein
MKPFREILFPSAFSQAVVRMVPYAREMAQRFNAHVTVLHAFDLAPLLCCATLFGRRLGIDRQFDTLYSRVQCPRKGGARLGVETRTAAAALQTIYQPLEIFITHIFSILYNQIGPPRSRLPHPSLAIMSP